MYEEVFFVSAIGVRYKKACLHFLKKDTAHVGEPCQFHSLALSLFRLDSGKAHFILY